MGIMKNIEQAEVLKLKEQFKMMLVVVFQL